MITLERIICHFFHFFAPKHLWIEQKSSYICNVNQEIDYPGRIPRGQDYIDTTH